MELTQAKGWKIENGDIAEITRRVIELRKETGGKTKLDRSHVSRVLSGERNMVTDIEVVAEIYFEEKATRPKPDLRAIALRQAQARAAA